MGAHSFVEGGHGGSPDRVFWHLVQSALKLHGRDGYTGTIAEKHEFTIHFPPPGVEPLEFARDLDANSWERAIDLAKYGSDDGFQIASRVFDDKWGPAVAIPGSHPGDWIFCGLASA